VITRLVDSRICLDVCPTSNVSFGCCRLTATNRCHRCWSWAWLAASMRMTRCCSGRSARRVHAVPRHPGLDAAALAGCARTSIEHSGAPTELKTRSQRAIDGGSRGVAGNPLTVANRCRGDGPGLRTQRRCRNPGPAVSARLGLDHPVHQIRGQDVIVVVFGPKPAPAPVRDRRSIA